jgi:hypothetical protein
MLGYQDFRQAVAWRRIMELTRQLRWLDLPAMAVLLRAELDALVGDLGDASACGLRQRNRAQVRYLLARMTAWLDQQCGVDHDFAWYTAGPPFEIEHVLANRPLPELGLTAKEFAELRNRLGALILLPKSTNASFGAMTYGRKLAFYAGQNLLARSLHPECYEHNPAFVSLVEQSGLPFQPYPEGFDETAIRQRQQLYRRMAARIWDPVTVGLAAGTVEAAPSIPRQRSQPAVSLGDLLRIGALRPARLVGEHLGIEYVAELTPRGTVRLESGAEFTSPSAAAMTALDRPSWNGWTFWSIVHQSGTRTRLEVIRRAALAQHGNALVRDCGARKLTPRAHGDTPDLAA